MIRREENTVVVARVVDISNVEVEKYLGRGDCLRKCLLRRHWVVSGSFYAVKLLGLWRAMGYSLNLAGWLVLS